MKIRTDMNLTQGLVPASCRITPSVIAESDDRLVELTFTAGDAYGSVNMVL